MQKRNISIILANMLDHFDSNLYGFIAPIMAPLFFPKQEPIVQLILAYSFLATSSITRPAGVVIFGWLATRYNPWTVLRITLIGVGISTFLMGCVPTFSSASYYSALILLTIRIIGGIFAQGEKTIASIYLLESQSNKHAVMTNAWFESSVIIGCAMASWAASSISEHTWRIPFWCGGLLALYTLFLRYRQKQPEISLKPTSFMDSVNQKKSLRSVLFLIFSGGLYYVVYDLSFILMNSFVPLVTDISWETMMCWNTFLLSFDMIIFVPVAYIIWRHDIGLIKQLSALMLALPAIPLFYFMQDASLLYVLLARFWIVIWGIVFSSVLNVCLLKMFPDRHKYLWIGLGTTVGSTLIGRSMSALCLWGWHQTHLSVVPGIYLFVVAMMVWLLSQRAEQV